jgi:hypothetical protein
MSENKYLIRFLRGKYNLECNVPHNGLRPFQKSWLYNDFFCVYIAKDLDLDAAEKMMKEVKRSSCLFFRRLN